MKGLLLDRDGIIIEDYGYVHKPEDVKLVEGFVYLAREAQNKGYILQVVSNQSGIARGYYSLNEVDELHAYLDMCLKQYGISISAYHFCRHHPDFSGNCLCRKPENLMLEKAIASYNLNKKECWMIGDKETDIEAGLKTGSKTCLLNSSALQNSKADLQITHLQMLLPHL